MDSNIKLGAQNDRKEVFTIKVKVMPNTKITKIEQALPDNEYDWRVHLTTQAVKGKANAALIKLLADEFGVSKSKITIISGHAQPIKVIEILLKKKEK